MIPRNCGLFYISCIAAGLALSQAPRIPSKSPSVAVAKEEAASPIGLLEEAYTVSANFAPEERADLLYEIASSAVRLNPGRAQEWSLELFATAQKIPQRQFRVAMRKSALATLALMDPLQAAELYSQQEPPGSPLPLEDVRSFGARTLFPNLWAKQGAGALPKIEELATWLGSTGQYPYTAMADIVLKVAKPDPEKAEALFAQAVSFLDKDPGFPVTNRDYTQFLLRTWKVPSSQLLRYAIEQGLKAIEKAAADDRRPKRFFEVSSAKGSVSFDSEADFLVFRLLPLVRQLDPDWATRLIEKYSALRRAPQVSLEDSPSIAAAVTVDPKTRQPGAVRAALDEHRLMQVPQMAQTDPHGAVQFAHSIGDPQLRAVAIASALPGYAKEDPKEAESWLRKIAHDLDSMEPGPNKLKLMVAVAKADFAMGRDSDAYQWLDRAMDLGEELFSRDLRANPGKISYMATGYDDLPDLAQLGAKKSREPVRFLTRIRQIQNDLLGARLLVFAARGFAEGGRAEGPGP